MRLRSTPPFFPNGRSGLVLLGLCLALAAAQPLAAQPMQPPLTDAIEAILNDEAFANAWWAAWIVNLNTGELLYERNAGRSFIPASNTKLYTTAAALDQLGPDFRYHTYVFADGPVVDGVLEGNLIVRGAGDPVIGGRFNDGDRTEVFRAWADSLRAAGITYVRGDLIGDDDVFDDQPLGYGWSWDDEPYWYSAEISGLSFNDNCVDVTIEAAQTPGAPGNVSWEPGGTDYVRVINRTLTLPADSSLEEGYARARGTNVIDLTSRVPAGDIDEESLTVGNPTLYFVHVLRETLLRAGIPVEGRPVDVDDAPIKPDYEKGMLRRIAVHTSPPLSEIVHVLNKKSHNLYAEMLLKTLAAERPLDPEAFDPEDYPPGSAERGLAVAMETFARAGVDTSRIQLVDGSGLSRMNLVTAEMTGAILTYMWHHPDPATREAFLASLPVSGTDGTLEYRYTDDFMRGKVRAKTGTVSNASTLSGYVVGRDETPYAFVLMSNHFTVKTSEIRAAQDAVVRLLAHRR